MTVFDLESTSRRLSRLYERLGYEKYKMSKFEEYELYVKNKDFLISDSIITFTDTNGRLMALKPDVTLSIIKNSGDIAGYVSKVYYNENVYRVSKGTNCFKEIAQVGLECIGDVDDYCISEVLRLAAESLECISDEYVLDVSHLGLVSSVLDGLELSSKGRRDAIKCIGERNTHELVRICREAGADEDSVQVLSKLTAIYGTADKVLPELEVMREKLCGDCLDQLSRVISVFEKTPLAGHIHIDFSVVSDINYYNGVVFKGFVSGVPESVLSGGQYDRMMQRMKRTSRAIGFAVYMDALEQLCCTVKEYDADIVLLYDESSDIGAVNSAAQQLCSHGGRVSAQRSLPEGMRCREAYKLSEGRLEKLG